MVRYKTPAYLCNAVLERPGDNTAQLPGSAVVQRYFFMNDPLVWLPVKEQFAGYGVTGFFVNDITRSRVLVADDNDRICRRNF